MSTHQTPPGPPPGTPLGNDKKRSVRHSVQHVIDGKTRHALISGDCLGELRRIPSAVADAVITDPPYGISYQGLNSKKPAILNDDHPFIWWLYDAARILKDGGALLCFCPWKYQETFRSAIETAGLSIRSQVIWDRMQHGMGATHCTFGPQHDIIWFATKGRFKFLSGRPNSIQRFANVPSKQRQHSTQKPEALMRKLIEHVTPPDGLVIDPCLGSGTTAMAALNCGRRTIGMELDPANIQTIRQNLRRRNTRLSLGGGNIKTKPCRPVRMKPFRPVHFSIAGVA